MTTDIDAVIAGDAMPAGKLLRHLKKHGIVPRIPDAEAFARKNLVLLTRHSASGVDLDISLAWTRFELEALEGSSNVRFGRVSAPMASAEDLITFKAIAARPKDIDDARALLITNPTVDVKRVRRIVGQLAGLADEPSLVEGLEEILAARSLATTTTRIAGRSPPKKMRKKANGKGRRPG